MHVGRGVDTIFSQMLPSGIAYACRAWSDSRVSMHLCMHNGRLSRLLFESCLSNTKTATWPIFVALVASNSHHPQRLANSDILTRLHLYFLGQISARICFHRDNRQLLASHVVSGRASLRWCVHSHVTKNLRLPTSTSMTSAFAEIIDSKMLHTLQYRTSSKGFDFAVRGFTPILSAAQCFFCVQHPLSQST